MTTIMYHVPHDEGEDMEKHSLIIDLRKHLPWHRRYISNITTLFLWLIWLALWRPMMVILGITNVHHHSISHHLFMMFLAAIEKGLMLLSFCSLLLLLWNRFVPYQSIKNVQAKTDDDYARYFALDVQQIRQGRQQKISVVYHDQNGKIIAIDNDK